MPEQPEGRSDFDFFFGTWDITNHRLVSRLTGSSEWETFQATQVCRPILGGIGNIDGFSAHSDGRDLEGASFRLFHPESGEWSIFWADNVTCTLQPPVVGRFAAGVGKFFGFDEHTGIPVLVRFR